MTTPRGTATVIRSAAHSGPAVLPRPPEWMKQAACAEIGASDGFDIWHPEKGGSTAEAKRICVSCVVRSECLEYALASGERYGIYGGKSERERRDIIRRRRGSEVAA